MRIEIRVPFRRNINKNKLQEVYEALLVIQNASDDVFKDDPDDLFNQALVQVKEKLDYLKYREAEIEDRKRQDDEEKEMRKNQPKP